jgi:hypothetical protein
MIRFAFDRTERVKVLVSFSDASYKITQAENANGSFEEWQAASKHLAGNRHEFRACLDFNLSDWRTVCHAMANVVYQSLSVALTGRSAD